MKDIFLVDADDTILDFHASSAVALKKAFNASGVEWEERFLSAFKIINDRLWESLERKELTRSELIERRFPIYLEHLGITVDAAEFNKKYLHTLATLPIYVKGAEEFLRELGKLGRVFIVTNGTERIQKSRFSICGLYGYAEDVFISDCIGCDKPNEGYTHYVIEHIKDFERERAVWIGDSLSADVKAANDAKITSVWFNPAKKPLTKKATPNYIAGDFDEILSILQRIRG